MLNLGLLTGLLITMLFMGGCIPEAAPEDGGTTVDMTVTVPQEKEQTFTGDIKIENTNDPTDYEFIKITLTTQRTRNTHLNIIERLLSHFPIFEQFYYRLLNT